MVRTIDSLSGSVRGQPFLLGVCTHVVRLSFPLICVQQCRKTSTDARVQELYIYLYKYNMYNKGNCFLTFFFPCYTMYIIKEYLVDFRFCAKRLAAIVAAVVCIIYFLVFAVRNDDSNNRFHVIV